MEPEPELISGEEKKEELAAISRVQDESDREGIRAVVEVRPEGDVQKILKLLYKYTDLETSFGINMVAIAGGKPMLMGLMDIIRYYVNYQREVVLRRTKFDLAAAKERCHILEGLIIAVRNIDEVVKIIKNADSTADARDKLRKRFDLSEKQAQAILDLRLARLTKLEVFKLEEELARLKELIEKLTAIVNSQKKQLDVVKEERNYTSSNKVIGANSKLGSVILKDIRLLSDEQILVISDRGNCYRLYGGNAACKFSDAGFTLSALFEDAEKDERPVALLPGEPGSGDLLFITAKGMLKKTAWSEYAVGKTMFQGIRLNEGDRLLTVQPDANEDGVTIFFVTKGGMCLNAKKDDIPAQGRVSGGVKGINLKDGDEVVFASQIDGEGEIVLATSDGRFKRIIAAQIDPLPRYRKGVQITSLKGESILFADYVTVPYMLAIVKDDGTMTELVTEDVPIDSTATRGRTLKGVKWKPVEIYAMKYREMEE